MDWFWLILFASFGQCVIVYPTLAARWGLPVGKWTSKPYAAVAALFLWMGILVAAFTQIAWWAPAVILVGGIWGGGVIFAILRQWTQLVGIAGTVVGLLALPFLMGILI